MPLGTEPCGGGPHQIKSAIDAGSPDHTASACIANAVETGFRKGNQLLPCRPKQKPPPGASKVCRRAALRRFGEMVYEAMMRLPSNLSTKPKSFDPELRADIAGLRATPDFYEVIG